MEQVVGNHLLLDFYGAKHLDDKQLIEKALLNAAEVCGAKVLQTNLHSFGNGLGVTGVLLLAESHISIHTWPETHFAALDIFMCGDCDPTKAIEPLKTSFSPSEVIVQRCQRGVIKKR